MFHKLIHVSWKLVLVLALIGLFTPQFGSDAEEVDMGQSRLQSCQEGIQNGQDRATFRYPDDCSGAPRDCFVGDERY